MATYRLKYTDDKKELFAIKDDSNKTYKNKYMDYLMSLIAGEQILDAKLKDNNLYLKYATDIIVLYNFDYFVGDNKYLEFKKAIKDFNDSQIQKNNVYAKDIKPKKNRASSINKPVLIGSLILSFSLLSFSSYKTYKDVTGNDLLSDINISEITLNFKNNLDELAKSIKIHNANNKDNMKADEVIFNSETNNEPVLSNTESENTYQNIELNYKRNYYLTNIQNAENYRILAEKYGKRYGIDSNLILAVMAYNGGIHTQDISSLYKVGIMQTAINRAKDGYYNYFNFDTQAYENRKFTEEELMTIDGNIEAWCIAFQLDLAQNENNIIAALEMNNALDKMNGFFNIAFYEEEKYKTVHNENEDSFNLEEGADEISFYHKLALNDYSDFGYLEKFKDENGNLYSYDVLSYLPVNTELKIKTPTENIIFEIHNIYNKNLILN